MDAVLNNPPDRCVGVDLLHFAFLWATKLLSYVCEDFLHIPDSAWR